MLIVVLKQMMQNARVDQREQELRKVLSKQTGIEIAEILDVSTANAFTIPHEKLALENCLF